METEEGARHQVANVPCPNKEGANVRQNPFVSHVFPNLESDATSAVHDRTATLNPGKLTNWKHPCFLLEVGD